MDQYIGLYDARPRSEFYRPLACFLPLKHDECASAQYLNYFEVLRLAFTSRGCFGPFAYSPNDPFGMVATHILPQVGHKNQNPSANSPGR